MRTASWFSTFLYLDFASILTMVSVPKCLTLLLGLVSITLAWQPGQDECPTAVKVQIPNDSAFESSGGIDTMDDVRTVLLTCPGIKSLDVYPHASGCEISPDRYNIPWSLQDSGKIPALEAITLREYDFDQREWERIAPPRMFGAPWGDTDDSWLHSWFMWFYDGDAGKWSNFRRIPQEQREKSNLDLWLDLMDWTKLKSLSISDVNSVPQGKALYERLPKMVPALESLSIGGTWFEKVPLQDDDGPVTEQVSRALEFILAFPRNSLKRLSWTEPDLYDGDGLRKVLEHHGQTLTSLEWRDAEREDARRPVFSVEQLRDIAAHAPALESLTIDLNRNGTWPMEELDAVVESFPKLKNLTIYFELVSDCYRNKESDYERSKTCSEQDCSGWDIFEKPLLDHKEAESLFEHLRKKKIGVELDSVTFRAGDWNPRDFEMLDSLTLLRDKKAFMDCTVRSPDGSLKVEEAETCQGKPAGFSKHQKKQLKRCSENPDRGEDYYYFYSDKDEL